MTVFELLDQIDETAPHYCQTCKHAYCHRRERCDSCLSDRASGQSYRNWEPGNPLRELHLAELAGEVKFVVGGQGEADFPATWTPEQVARQLHHAAEQCGYMAGHLSKRVDGVQCLTISTHEGTYRIEWSQGRLDKIAVQDRQGAHVRDGWRRDDPSCRW